MALRVTDGRHEQVLPLADEETPARVTSDGIAYVLRGARLRAARVADATELWQSAPFRVGPGPERETFAHGAGGDWRTDRFLWIRGVDPAGPLPGDGCPGREQWGASVGLARTGAPDTNEWRTEPAGRARKGLRHHCGRDLRAQRRRWAARVASSWRCRHLTDRAVDR